MTEEITQLPVKKPSLRELLEKQVAALEEVFDQMPDEEFTPEKLAELQIDIKEKIDALYHVILKYERDAEMYDEEYVKPWAKARDAMNKKAENLRKYIHQQMAEKGYDKLPGVHWRVQFQKSSPALRYHTEPSATLYLNKDYRDYMVQDVTYRWNTEAIKTTLAGGNTLAFAELTHGRHIRFYPNKKNEEGSK